jgi:hypothetical protein
LHILLLPTPPLLTADCCHGQALLLMLLMRMRPVDRKCTFLKLPGSAATAAAADDDTIVAAAACLALLLLLLHMFLFLLLMAACCLLQLFVACCSVWVARGV